MRIAALVFKGLRPSHWCNLNYPNTPGRETVMTAMTRALSLPRVSDIHPNR